MNLLVLSTSWRSQNATICKASVRSQTGLDALGVTMTHQFIEASTQTPPKTKLQNLSEAIAPLDPETVVAFVDGDDHLAHRGALARVMREHAMGHWVTYGSFVQSDGKPGFAAPYETPEYRREAWKATHLKTLRAGLFQKIPPEYLQYKGSWIDRADDPAFMISALELAGRDQVKFIEEILYVYDYGSAWEKEASPEDLAHQNRMVHYVRKLRPLARLESI
jgi:hypothetical protein